MNRDNILGHSYRRGKIITYPQPNRETAIKYDKEQHKQMFKDFQKQVEREEKKMIRYREFTVAIDFDDTIAEAHNFPEIGDLKHQADVYINKMYDAGYNVIINTCRTDSHQEDAERYLREKGIKFHHINCNLPANIEFFNQDCRKISADVYIDDRCVMGLPETWEEIYNLVELKAEKYYGREENTKAN